jgi:endonuclease/exonuclease/phosphatase family metal-dependent hydrolase
MTRFHRFLPLAFLLVVLSQWLVWTVGLIGTPHPYVFVGLMGSSLLGGVGLVFIGLLPAPEIGFGKRAFCVASGILAWCGAGVFTYAILSNHGGDIAVANQHPLRAESATRIRVLNLNVLHGFPEFETHEARFQRTVDEFQGIQADIIVLQEAWSTTEHGSMVERLAKALGMNYVFARANGSRRLIGFEEGSAILSRYPIVSARRVVLAPREPFWENRIALLADVNLGGEVVTIAGVHLSTSIPDDQAENLLTVLPAKGLMLVAGDFNAEPDSGAVAHMEGAGFKRLTPTEARVCFPSTLMGGMPAERIDHVFLSPESQKRWSTEKSVYVLTSIDLQPCDWRLPISDHNAIVVDLVRR